MRVLQVSAEIFPLLKTGGLADVTGALPKALSASGCDVRVLLPGFPAIAAGVPDAALVAEVTAPWGERAALRYGPSPVLGVGVYWIDAPERFARAGDPYADARLQPYLDNAERFAWLGWCAALLAGGVDASWCPQLVHSHDWHAGLAPAYLAHQPAPRRAASVHTVHNLAYQGVFPAEVFGRLGLPRSVFDVEGVEFHGQVSYLKAGLYYADRITTVSPTYAREIQTEAHGCGLHGLLKRRSGVLSGILNGVDDAVWDPATDALIAHRYDARAGSAGKRRCKAALQQALGLREAPAAPLFGVVSRLTEQKGMHLVLAGIPELLGRGAQLVVLGSGDALLEAQLRAAADERSDAVAVRVGYDEPFAHQIFAASDVTLVPSRFEPCGLTQLYGLRYGSLPLVHRTGGLADTVVDCTLEDMAEERATGFVFEPFTESEYRRALRRAFALHARPADWRAVRRRGMNLRFGWAEAAEHYLAVYRAALRGVE